MIRITACKSLRRFKLPGLAARAQTVTVQQTVIPGALTYARSESHGPPVRDGDNHYRRGESAGDNGRHSARPLTLSLTVSRRPSRCYVSYYD
jgi:hypothetical protein